MTTSRSEQAGSGSDLFGEEVALSPPELEAMLATLEAVAARCRSRWRAQRSPALSCRLDSLAALLCRQSATAIEHRARPLPIRIVPNEQAGMALAVLAREVVLDIAAELLDLAAVLLEAGSFVEAFALEGIEGRLLEALLSAELA